MTESSQYKEKMNECKQKDRKGRWVARTPQGTRTEVAHTKQCLFSLMKEAIESW
jgi:hypothetical protein